MKNINSKKLREARFKTNLTQLELSEQSGINQTDISKAENGMAPTAASNLVKYYVRHHNFKESFFKLYQIDEARLYKVMEDSPAYESLQDEIKLLHRKLDLIIEMIQRIK